jgi:hypothetical protein
VPAYRFAGLTLACDFALPELPSAPPRCRSALSITAGRRRVRDAGHDWRHRWRLPGGRVWMRLARADDAHVIQFPGLAEFRITPQSIACHPRLGVPRSTIRHLLLDQVLPATLASAARLVLHASAVEIRGRAVGFVGPAGAGKSTIAAALVRRGATTLTDDALVIDARRSRPLAVPAYPGLRLWPDSRAIVGASAGIRRTRVAHYTHKQRWTGGGMPFCAKPVRLDSLYLIVRGRAPRIRAMSGRHAVMALVRYSMLLDATDRAAVRHGFEAASDVAARVAVRQLVVPRGPAALAAVCDVLAR